MLVEQCGGTVEQCWWDSVVEQWNSDGGKVYVEQCDGTVWWKCGTVMVEQCGRTVEQCWR